MGFCMEEDEGLAPAQDHIHAVGVFVDKSVKFTHPESHGIVMFVGKLGTGTGQELTRI